MHIEQLYTNCLAEAAYYIESEGEAAIIDPIRETEPYTSLASQRNSRIKYVFETHFHADFVSGHIDLAQKTGAQIVYGPGAETSYVVHNAKDGDEFKIGKLTIKVLHTPGHTLESTCYLLLDEKQKPYCLFSGDTLFVGDVGRPDLLDSSGITKEFLAGLMFESLATHIKTLADDVIVYPAHGPGSSCGKNIGKETWSTIGQQKKTNYYLLETDKQAFVQQLTSGILPPPPYFFEDARINKSGYTAIDTVVNKNARPLSLVEFEEMALSGALLLDTRDSDSFEKFFIPGAINIGLNGQFAQWLGTLIHIERPIVLITDPGKERESVLRAARVGYENIQGFLEGGVKTWSQAGKPVDAVESIDASSFYERMKTGKYTALDVRKPGEFEAAHVKDAQFISLSDLPSSYNFIDKNKNYLVYCGGGYRSMIAVSLLKANGFKNAINVYGGFGQIKDCGIAVVALQTV